MLGGWYLWSTMVSVEQSVGQMGTKGPRLSPQPQRVPSILLRAIATPQPRRIGRARSPESEIECTSPTRSTCLGCFPLPSGGERAIGRALMRQACPPPPRPSSRRQRALPPQRGNVYCATSTPPSPFTQHPLFRRTQHIRKARCGVWKESINTRSGGLGGKERRDISLHLRAHLSQKKEGERERGRKPEQSREKQEREIEGAEPTRTVRMAA